MLPKARARTSNKRPRRRRRMLGWLFAKKGNRKIRKTLPSLTPAEDESGRVAVVVEDETTARGIVSEARERKARDATDETRDTGEHDAPVNDAEPRASWLSSSLSGIADAFLARRRAILTAGVGICLAAGAWAGRFYVTHARHFAVQHVRVTHLQHVGEDALIARAGVPLGVNLFAVDRNEIARNLTQEPWVARAKVRVELPATIVIDAVEREAACGVALGSLYLADATGNVFKRATPEEAANLPVVTGIARDAYVADAERAKADVRNALVAVAAWNSNPAREKLGEAHLDRVVGLTLYTESGIGVRIGAVDESIGARLERLDAVLAALASSPAGGGRPRLVYVDNRARPDRVTVKLAANEKVGGEKVAPAINAAHSANQD
jgi:cell division protein FtsQ